MVNHAHTKKYVQRILKMMPDDRPIRAKDLMERATSGEYGKPIGPNTLYRYLKFMEGKYIDKSKPKHRKEAYYLKKHMKLAKLSEDIINEKMDFLLKELRKRVEKTIKLEVEGCEDKEGDCYCPFVDEKDKQGFINGIINEDELVLTLGRIMIEYGKKLEWSAYKGLYKR